MSGPSAEPVVPRSLAAEVGMAIFLGSWTILFAALALTFFAARDRSLVWPPDDLPSVPLAAGTLATGLLLASSLALGGQASGRSRRLVAAILGAGFVAVQLRSFLGLWRDGMTPAGGPAASAFFTITCLHAVHVAIGVTALAILAWRARPSLWVWYWHVMAAVWLALYFFLYVGW